MAKQDSQSTSSVDTRSFDKSLVEDVNDFHLPQNVWTQARNVINNSKSGDLGKLGNEPGNQFCARAPYTIIGGIHLEKGKWEIFSTNNTDSEIGVFDEETCSYITLVNDKCLNFNTNNLIIGVAKPNGDCAIDTYWEDGRRNPSRTLTVNMSNPYDQYVPWVCADIDPSPTCVDCQPIFPLQLDCDKIRLAPLIKMPCLRVEKGVNGGTLLNGSYFVVAAYTVNQLRITDYSTPSNVQSLFEHENVASSLDIFVDFTDDRFDEYELVLVSTVNQQTVARRVGIYSTRQSIVTLDLVNNTWTTVPIELISVRNSVVETADAMFTVADNLVRVGPQNKFDFNYQPLANQIVVKWQAVEYPADYYRKGGNNTGYLRDEVYPFFVRWVYSTGDKSNSYHIPGRPSMAYPALGPGVYDDSPYFGIEALVGDNQVFESFNTGVQTALPGTILPDGGVVIAEGLMGYWESTELYPDDDGIVWNAGILLSPYSAFGLVEYGGASHDLCGKPIRHHKMPDNETTVHFENGGDKIRILGLGFENIKPPVDNSGVLIPGIVGYEILRGSRQGNRSIIAKGMFNNMGLYTVPGNLTTRRGAYANYPYNDVNPDPFLSLGETNTAACNIFNTTGGGLSGFTPQSEFSCVGQNTEPLFSFHSPDTNFTHPFLSVKEVKSYGQYRGLATGKFEYSEKHPRHKVVTNLSFLASSVAGLGIAYLAMSGKRTTVTVIPHIPGYSQDGLSYPSITGVGAWLLGTGTSSITTVGTPMTPGSDGSQPTFSDGVSIGITESASINTAATVYNNSLANLGVNVLGLLGGQVYVAEQTYDSTLGSAGNDAFIKHRKDIEQTDGEFSVLPSAFRVLTGLPTFLYYLAEGTDATLRLIKNILRFRDFGLKYNSHCFYNGFVAPIAANRRRTIVESNYIGPNIQDFGAGYRINNEYRSTFVATQLDSDFRPIVHFDNTRSIRIGDPFSASTLFGGNTLEEPTLNSFNTGSSAAYVGLKQRIRNQYGQLQSILQMPVSDCIEYVTLPLSAGTPVFLGTSPTMFNGDIYIGRYTEKNTFFYFYEWLFDQPDGFEFDYLKHRMLLYPTYWANFENFETQDFTSSILSPATNIFIPSNWTTPSDFYVLDGTICDPLQFAVKNAWFYLFNSGIRDFFVESEINIDLRDWGTTDSERHYDPYRYTEQKIIFDTSIIKATNYFKYDQSLSVSKTYINYISWGALQLTSYDPFLAESCFEYRPKRVIYSLPGNFESNKDFWRVFLPLNYKDFIAQVTCIKPINKSGAIIFFDAASPIQFQGTDTLETGLGTKLVIGDGALFAQPMQSIVNVDDPYEYASCQNRLSVMNTPAGLYWISENQGKIFRYGNGGMRELSSEDLRWWFSNYLPYKILDDFPQFNILDNAITGVACQSVYDNENGLVYFCKKDYELRKDITDVVTYNPTTRQFLVNGILVIEIGDPNYFNSASWTISYDPKVEDGEFLGYHDWHPDLLFPTRNTFMSVSRPGIDPLNPNNIRTNGIWIHNFRCDLYCNYYGLNYPFEVEWNVHTAQTVNTLRSIEYYMEAYKYAPNCYDRYHLLEENFDEAVIYNTEQCSGLLKLDLTPRNDLPLLIQYPIINFTNIQILFSKVENRYRFNMFWDVTRERGGQDVGIPGVPAYAQQMIWNTPANGYAKTLNANNMNYTKSEVQRKKFRHYTNSVLLRKLISGDAKIMVMLTDNKNLYSPR